MYPASDDVTAGWGTLAVVGLVQLMVVLDATIVNIALPSAQADLGLSDGDRHWVITAYILFFGGLLLLGGRIADRFGTRRVLFLGLAGFAVASVLGGAAPGGGALFAARALQGAFAALLAPAALSLLSTTYTEPRQRGIAFGAYGALSSGGAAVGLLAGGMLTEFLDWRWCLYVNVPIAVLALTGGAAAIPRTRPGADIGLDIPGAVLSCAGLAAIVLGFAQAESRGWGDQLVIALLVAGAALLVALARVESTVRCPLLPPRILLHRARGGAFLAVALSQVALFGFFLFITYYMQAILGYSPVLAGLAFLPLTVATAIGASVVGARLLPLSGPRPLIVAGLLLAAAGMAALTQLQPDTQNVYLVFLLPAQLAIGSGLGLVMMPAMSTATADIDAPEAGVASAAVNAAQQIGGALGTALLNTIAASVTVAALASNTATDQVSAQVQGYTTGIAFGAAVLAATAVLCYLILPTATTAPRK
ncbi:MFS transporter [Nocardia donostiensis]|uniref:MFS transporter n=1 Tax=Nocardia donostiensis TaxID=1538463 RepID=A0A1V2TB38_9NOCA|nr:MFS transporter [Nocardia donostiensis]OQS12799.1 MFS transporter [Nocardia donostiensis]OQS19352.1 MFS transporter [Nocardia donostiensis]